MDFLNRWIQAMANWFLGMHVDVCWSINTLELWSFKKRGFLVTVNHDWTSLNFPLLIKA